MPNWKQCYRQYCRGVRCAKRVGGKHRSLMLASLSHSLYVPDKKTHESEYLSFVAGWNDMKML